MPSESSDPDLQAEGPGGDDRALELYRLAVEEYRFQAEFNWKRTQYLLAFNVAVAALGVALIPRSDVGASLVFALGLIAAALTAAVTRVQHIYYRAARDRMRVVENDIDVPTSWKINTTATLGGRSRKVSVTQLVYLLLVSIAVANASNIFVIIVR